MFVSILRQQIYFSLRTTTKLIAQMLEILLLVFLLFALVLVHSTLLFRSIPLIVLFLSSGCLCLCLQSSFCSSSSSSMWIVRTACRDWRDLCAELVPAHLLTALLMTMFIDCVIIWTLGHRVMFVFLAMLVLLRFGFTGPYFRVCFFIGLYELVLGPLIFFDYNRGYTPLFG